MTPDQHQSIHRRAEEIYIRNGRVPGHDLENWAQAEREIIAESLPARRAAIVIKVNGAQYVGEYNPSAAEGYLPGELGRGAPVPVRLHGNKMFINRPNGKVLATTIINKIG
jgi:hypothetical protein